jgi:hypothetical protein
MFMLSLGDIRKRIQPWVVRIWIGRFQEGTRRTRVAGLELEVRAGVFHPRNSVISLSGRVSSEKSSRSWLTCRGVGLKLLRV